MRAAFGLFTLFFSSTVVAAAPDGAQIYQDFCEACHADPLTKAPAPEAMALMSQSRISASLIDGVMEVQGAALTEAERDAVTRFLSSNTEAPKSEFVQCEAPTFTGDFLWSGWSPEATNTRFQSERLSGLQRENLQSLGLMWALGFPVAIRARSQPVVTEEAVFVGSQDGTVYALDIETGCLYWSFKAEAEVRGAMHIGGDEIHFSDFDANVYGVKYATGELAWRTNVADNPNATITGSMAQHDGVLYVPLSSTEVLSAVEPSYECCTFRGSIVALDRADGRELWRSHTVAMPEKQGRNSAGAMRWGPSGAPVWSTPTIDLERGLLYVGTGQNYSSPATDLSDAILALDIETGALKWSFQGLAEDAWNAGCVTNGVNCPEEDGPDYDFGAAPMLITLEDGSQMIIAGQKSGDVYALDPDNQGKLVWRNKLGRGGKKGGVHWGMAYDGSRIYVAIGDLPSEDEELGPGVPGISALDPLSGDVTWNVPLPRSCEEDSYACYPSVSAALTVTDGVLFAGGMDGRLMALSTETGDLLWAVETAKPYATLNGILAQGGSFDSDGAVLANGRLAITSGYDLYGQMPGNVLLMFGLERD